MEESERNYQEETVREGGGRGAAGADAEISSWHMERIMKEQRPIIADTGGHT